MFYNTEEVKRIKNTSPLYNIGEIVDLNTWAGKKYDFKVIDIQVIYHHRCNGYTWGYKLHKENERTTFSFDYIPEGYLRKKGEN